MIVKKFLKGFMAAALAVTMAVTPVSSVKAAPETMPDGTIFDAEYYAQTYPDVANAVGTDKDALYNHYVTFGKAEGRLACAPTTGQTNQNPIVPSTQFKNPLTAKTTPTQALAYIHILPDFMLTDSRPTLVNDDYSGAVRKYEYDVYGNIIKVDGIAYDSYLVCDAEGRIVGIRYNSYTDENMIDTCIYNEQGQLIQIDSIYPYYAYKFYYDDLGRLIKVTGGNNNLLDEFHYDEQGKTVSKKRGSGEVEDFVNYVYDEQGRLVKVVTHHYVDYGDLQGAYYWIYEYDTFGKLARTKSAVLVSGSKSNFGTEHISDVFSYN